MATLPAAEVAKIVGPYLADSITGNITLSVVEEKIHHEDIWWRVPLEPSRWPERLFPLYEDLAAIEEHLREDAHLDILLLLAEPAAGSEAELAAV